MPRGGKREGAGAPSQDKVSKSFRLRRELVEWLQTQPDQTKVIEEGIKAMQKLMSKFQLDNRGKVWSRSHSDSRGSKTEEHLKYGRPDQATHLVYNSDDSMSYVAYHDPNAPDEQVQADWTALGN